MPVSGFTDTGDGIYIETNYGYPIMLELSDGCDIISENAQSLRIFDDPSNVHVNIINAYIDGELVLSDAASDTDLEIDFHEEAVATEEINAESIDKEIVESTAVETIETTVPPITSATEPGGIFTPLTTTSAETERSLAVETASPVETIFETEAITKIENE